MASTRTLTTLLTVLLLVAVGATAAHAEAPSVAKARALVKKLERSAPKCDADSCRKALKNKIRKAKWKLKVAQMTPEERKAMRDGWKKKRAKMSKAERAAARERRARALEAAAATEQACEESAAKEQQTAVAPAAPAPKPTVLESRSVALAAAPQPTTAPVTETVLASEPAPVTEPAPEPAAAPVVADKPLTCDDPSVCRPCEPGMKCVPCPMTPTGRVFFLENVDRFESDLAGAFMARGMAPEKANQLARAERDRARAWSVATRAEGELLRTRQLKSDSPEYRTLVDRGEYAQRSALLKARRAARLDKADVARTADSGR